jgi:hypothetical protein
MQEQHKGLAKQSEKSPNSAQPQLQERQAALDQQMRHELQEAKRLLDPMQTQAMPRPAQATDPHGGGSKERNDNSGGQFKPALSNETSRPQGSDGATQQSKGPNQSPTKSAAHGEMPANKQSDNLQQLDAAQKALQSDEKAVGRMMVELMSQTEKAARSAGEPKGQGGTSPAAHEHLKQMLQSQAMQDAMAMAGRARQGRAGQQSSGQPNPGGTTPNLSGSSPPRMTSSVDLDELSPRLRDLLLQYPPHEREELLQGMREQAPEGYERFVQDYFKRLTQSRLQSK